MLARSPHLIHESHHLDEARFGPAVPSARQLAATRRERPVTRDPNRPDGLSSCQGRRLMDHPSAKNQLMHHPRFTCPGGRDSLNTAHERLTLPGRTNSATRRPPAFGGSPFAPGRPLTGLTASLLALAVCLEMAGCERQPATAAAGPPEVQVITLQPADVPVHKEWIGTLDGSVNAQIRAQVTGYLVAQKYAEGSRVKKGDVLFEIDARPFQAALDQAEAKLAQDQAQHVKNQLDVKRYAPLAEKQALSQEELDNATQAEQAAAAQVKADEAMAEIARVNLGFTRICSPIDGVAGLATAQIGDLLSPSSGTLTTVSTLDPIRVYFPVDEGSYLNFWRQFTSPAAGDSSPAAPALNLVLIDGSTYPLPGKFLFADRQLNVNTGTLQITGLFRIPIISSGPANPASSAPAR